MNDGNQPSHLTPNQKFTSEKECCEVLFPWKEDCVPVTSPTPTPAPTLPFFPLGGEGCVSSTRVPEYITSAYLYDTKIECCEENFGWMFDSCVENLNANALPPPTPKPTNQPTVRFTPDPSPPPSPLPTNSPTVRITPNPTPLPTQRPTNQPMVRFTPNPTPLPTPRPTRITPNPPSPQPTNVTTKRDSSESNVNFSVRLSDLFYPFYKNGNSVAECRSSNDGNVPGYMTLDMLKSSREECCSSYFFPWSADECMVDNSTGLLFYPNFKAKACVADGNAPDYMIGKYFSTNKQKCCDMFFSKNENLLQNCNGS